MIPRDDELHAQIRAAATPRLRAERWLALARHLTECGRHAEAADAAESAERVAERIGEDEIAAHAALHVALSCIEAGDRVAAREAAARALPALRAGVHRLAEARALLIVAEGELASGDTEAGTARLVDGTVALDGVSPASAELAAALAGAATLYGRVGALTPAHELARRAVNASRRVAPELEARTLPLAVHALLALAAAQPPDAFEQAEAQREEAIRLAARACALAEGDEAAAARAALAAGEAQLAVGDTAAAAALAEAAASIIGAHGHEAARLAELEGGIALQRGDAAAAVGPLTRAIALHARGDGGPALEARARARAELGEHEAAYEDAMRLLALRAIERSAGGRRLDGSIKARLDERRAELGDELATRDHVTGLGNRLLLERRLPELVAEATRTGRPLSVALLRLAHAVPDEVLRAAGRVITGRIRSDDVVVRQTADTFAILFPGCPSGSARARCEDVRGALAGLRGATGPTPVETTSGISDAYDPDAPLAVVEAAFRDLDASGETGVRTAA